MKGQTAKSHIIYKYPVPVMREIKLSLPRDSEILCLKYQAHNDGFQLWVLHDTEKLNDRVDVQFVLSETGRVIEVGDANNEILCYIDSEECLQGRLIFHLFRVVSINDYFPGTAVNPRLIT